MRECLVIALVLSLTGTVLGRQSDSRSTNFDSSRTDSSRLLGNSPDSTKTPPQPDAVDRIMKLDIDTGMIDAIIGGQVLEAAIDLKNATNGIVMFFHDPTTIKPRVDEVPKNLKPHYSSGSGVLHFTLDEVGLQRLKTEGLQYAYRPGEKGTYQKVSLKYVPSTGTRSPDSQTIPPRQDRRPVNSSLDNDEFVSARGRNPSFDRSTSRSDPDRLTGLPRDRQPRDAFDPLSDSPRRDFSATSAKTDSDRFFEQQQALDRQRELDSQQVLDRQRPANRARQYGLDHSRDNQDQTWNSQASKTRNFNERDTHTFHLTDEEIDKLAMSTQQIRDQREHRETELERLQLDKLASDSRAQRATEDRQRMLQQLRDRTSLDQTPVARRRLMDDEGLFTSYGQRDFRPSAADFARTASLDSQFDARATGRYSNQVATSETARLLLQEAALENEELRRQIVGFKTDRLRVENQTRVADLGNLTPNNQGRRTLQLSDLSASIPGRQNQDSTRPPGANVPQTVTSVSGTHMTSTAVDHILQSYYDGANFEQVANRVKGEVAAISAAKTRVDKFNGFLLFLFITFFALSLYLGWLAQSFYGQYGELADELRETFTATT